MNNYILSFQWDVNAHKVNCGSAKPQLNLGTDEQSYPTENMGAIIYLWCDLSWSLLVKEALVVRLPVCCAWLPAAYLWSKAFSQMLFHCNADLKWSYFCCNSIYGPQIGSNFHTCHDSITAVSCEKLCRKHSLRLCIWIRHTFLFDLNHDREIISEMGSI